MSEQNKKKGVFTRPESAPKSSRDELKGFPESYKTGGPRPFGDSEYNKMRNDARKSVSNARGTGPSLGVAKVSLTPFGNKPQTRVVAEEVPAWIKRYATLNTEKGRTTESKFLVEGENCVREALDSAHDLIEKVYVLQGFENPALLKRMAERKVNPEVLSKAHFSELTTTQTTQGIIAVLRMAEMKPNYDTARFLTLVDSIQDPGNLGAIFRTSVGLGLNGIVMSKGTVDPFNPKVVRGSSGTFLRMPFETRVDLAERISFLKSKGFQIIATSPHAKETLGNVKLRRKVAFLIGNEGAGADNRFMDLADETVSIPMANSLESLNVSVAHAIVAYEVCQKRHPADV